MEIFLGLGSNVGNREDNLRHAIERLAPEIRLEKHSAIYRTMPMYVKEQPEFLNMTIQAETELSAHEVFQKIDTIQKEMGEHRKNQPPTKAHKSIFFFFHKKKNKKKKKKKKKEAQTKKNAPPCILFFFFF